MGVLSNVECEDSAAASDGDLEVLTSVFEEEVTSERMEDVEMEEGWAKDKVTRSEISVVGTKALVGCSGLFACVDAVVAGTGEFLDAMPVVKVGT